MAISNYGNKELEDIPSAVEDAQTIVENFKNLGVQEDRIFHLVNPEKQDFYVAMKKVKE